VYEYSLIPPPIATFAAKAQEAQKDDDDVHLPPSRGVTSRAYIHTHQLFLRGAGTKETQKGHYTTVSTVFFLSSDRGNSTVCTYHRWHGSGAAREMGHFLPRAKRRILCVCVCVCVCGPYLSRERWSRVDAVVSVVCEGPWSRYRI